MVKKKAKSSILIDNTMIDSKNTSIFINRQCDLLGLSRSSYYYKPDSNKIAKENFYKKQIFEEYLKHPFYGYRKITKAIRKKGYKINKKRIQRLMQEMGIQAIYPKPNLSKPSLKHKKYPYLLRGLNIDHSNHVWATDITYIKITGGFIYLVAIIDIYSRKVLSWKISNTMDVDFCIDILKEAIDKYGKPEIFNSDQGSQFTSNDFTDILKDNKIKISMDGKGRALDNIYIERLWRSLKYEDIYIKEYQTVLECAAGIDKYFEFYNTERFHQSLKYETPDDIYFNRLKLKKAS
jgi:putative transposase